MHLTVLRQSIMYLGDLNGSLFDPWHILNHFLPLISRLGSPIFRFVVYLHLLYQDTLLWFSILLKCCMLWVDLMGQVSSTFF